MGIEDLIKMDPRDLQVLIASKVEQIADVDLPEIKNRLKDGDKRFQDHEGRLVKIETAEEVKNSLLGNGKRKVAAGSLSVTAISGIVYGVGKAVGWW